MEEQVGKLTTNVYGAGTVIQSLGTRTKGISKRTAPFPNRTTRVVLETNNQGEGERKQVYGRSRWILRSTALNLN